MNIFFCVKIFAGIFRNDVANQRATGYTYRPEKASKCTGKHSSFFCLH